jgi:hypothetical protein
MKDEPTPQQPPLPEAASAGPGQVVVEPTPLPGTRPAGFRDTSLTRPHAGCLELRPSLAAHCFGLAYLLIGAICSFPLLLVAFSNDFRFQFRADDWQALFDSDRWFLWLVLVAPLLGLWFLGVGVCKLLFGGRRLRFDLDTGWVSAGTVRVRRIHPLQKVVAVQIAFGGMRTALGRTTPFKTYQLNAVLAHSAEVLEAFGDLLSSVLGPSSNPRLNLTHHPDLAWTRRAARELANFLQVPLVDQTGNGE